MRGKRRTQTGKATLAGGGSSSPTIYEAQNSRQGISRKPGGRHRSEDLPPTPPQMEVLRLLTDDWQAPRDLAIPLRVTSGSVSSRLYALKRKGLAEKNDAGEWRRMR